MVGLYVMFGALSRVLTSPPIFHESCSLSSIVFAFALVMEVVAHVLMALLVEFCNVGCLAVLSIAAIVLNFAGAGLLYEAAMCDTGNFEKWYPSYAAWYVIPVGTIILSVVSLVV